MTVASIVSSCSSFSALQITPDLEKCQLSELIYLDMKITL